MKISEIENKKVNEDMPHLELNVEKKKILNYDDFETEMARLNDKSDKFGKDMEIKINALTQINTIEEYNEYIIKFYGVKP